jgi:hypothetical protein
MRASTTFPCPFRLFLAKFDVDTKKSALHVNEIFIQHRMVIFVNFQQLAQLIQLCLRQWWALFPPQRCRLACRGSVGPPESTAKGAILELNVSEDIAVSIAGREQLSADRYACAFSLSNVDLLNSLRCMISDCPVWERRGGTQCWLSSPHVMHQTRLSSTSENSTSNRLPNSPILRELSNRLEC